jgi:SecD/SecF fusion protein
MSDRRRNIFVLLIVAGLILASVFAIFSKPTRLGLDLRGGVELVYQAQPTPQQPVVNQEALDRAIDVMRERVDRLGVSEPAIQRSGANQITVGLPDVHNAERAQQQVGQVAQLFFYDWEPNVLGPGCKPAPSDADVTGGPGAGTAGAISQYDAVRRAAQCPERNDGNNTTDRNTYYLVNTKTERVVAGPQDTRPELFEGRTQKQPGPDEQVVTIKPGTAVVQAEQPAGKGLTGKGTDQYYVLRDNVALRGTDIKNPEQNFDQGAGGTGQPIVTFDFTSKGRKIWQDVTRKIAQRGQESLNPALGITPDLARQHFAIVLDNRLISVPYIDFQQNPDGIDARNGSQIQGGFTIQSAQELANLLKTGALPVRLDLISQSQVSASLGQQALNQSLVAGAVGLAVVALFLLVFYRVLGVIAVTALAVYALFLFALIKLIPVTMTLPGIAGLVLTIGVAADANIVIFERVKEEIRAGRSIMAGIATGYRKGLTAIIDANVVTVMVAFILFVLATAGVRGFALTLGIGTLVSFFTAVLFTQAVLGTMGRTRLLSRPTALGAGEQRHRWTFDFMGASKWFFSMSGIILAVGALGLGAQGLNFGIDFDGGTRIRTALQRPADENQVRSVLAAHGAPDAEIQRVSDPKLGTNVFQISTEELGPQQVQSVRSALDQRFGVGNNFSNDSIGPTFGKSVANSAVVAIIASLVVISAYIALRFEWKYAVPVLVALSHDLLITAGVYALLGEEVTTATVAALLTILGFSLYDTIIVFDRIRENVPRMPRAAFSQIVNRSMSEVLTRSLATSLCTLLPILGLFFFGGDTLRQFAVALIIGTASGTYSSVFIAGPVLTHWKERERVWTRRRQAVIDVLGEVPAYATEVGGAPVDVAPKERRRARRGLTAPEDPERSVSRDEFDEMVRDISDEIEPEERPRRQRPPRRATAVEEPAPPPPASHADDAADAQPEDVVMPDEERRDRPRRPRNRRHGRPR